MNNLLPKVKLFFTTYKWLLFPLIPILIFIILLIVILTKPQTQKAPQSHVVTIPTPTTATTQNETGSTQPTTPPAADAPASEDLGYEKPLEQQDGFQEKASQNDGSTVYYFSSENPNRPNIVIKSADGEIVYTRKLNSQKLPFSLVSAYENTYGAPDRVTTGAKSYQNATLYVFASIGLAVIADTETGSVYEEQLFPQMNVDEYLQKYGKYN
jgi:cytoskeletal protein RodZ